MGSSYCIFNVTILIRLLIFKIILGQLLRQHSKNYLDLTDTDIEVKSHLDKVLRVHAPSHFLPFNPMVGDTLVASPKQDDSDERIDNIDRFTMVKSRIV